MEPGPRARLREMRLDAAARGVRAPVPPPVAAPNCVLVQQRGARLVEEIVG
jgi:hypothetical protein